MRKTIFLVSSIMCFINAEAQVSLNTSSITSFGYNSAKQSGYGTFIGSHTGNKISSSANNSTFIGHYAGISTTTGSNNTFVGRSSGYYNTTGTGNTAIGTMSLQNNTTGSTNTCIGFYSGYNTKGSGNVLIGYQAGYNETGSNKLYISNSNTASPLIWGDFSSKKVQINGLLTTNGSLTVNGNISTPASISLQGAVTANGGFKAGSSTIITRDGKMGIGTTTTDALLTIYATSNPNIKLKGGSSTLELGVATASNCYATGAVAGDVVMRSLGQSHNIILSMSTNNMDGKSFVGVGDDGNRIWAKFCNDKTLRVDGTIKATLINVVTNVWADDVFNDDYKVPTINEIEEYIETNKHLPDVPSAAQVQAEGINVAEMSAVLLRKIEELTLIVIEQNKQIEKLKEQIKQ